MHVGDLVRCAPWTLFPGRLGQIVRVEVRDRDNPYKQYDQRLISLYRVLVDGEIREFLGWDVELISE